MQLARCFAAALVLLAHVGLAARHIDSEEMRTLLAARDEDAQEQKNPIADLLKAPGKMHMEQQKRQMKLAQMKYKMEHPEYKHQKHHYGHYGQPPMQPVMQPGMQPGYPGMHMNMQPQPGYYQAPQPAVRPQPGYFQAPQAAVQPQPGYYQAPQPGVVPTPR
eukprot:TRINITY_DN241_c0_g3_i5.p1 TRINITY_DN241_c0_g3~~TRINITY_DN241_c0_g3_i5.p1  ORF type:complete len:162 (+),score=35.28 TRINITY_DN241_c0_g3_i5:73-558(+)